MDALRISLVVIGVVIVLAIYLVGRYRRRHEGAWATTLDETSEADIAELEGFTALRDDDVPAATDMAGISTATDAAQPGESLLIVLNIFARSAEGFSGAALEQALRDCGFTFGDMRIYHLYPRADQSSGLPICSVANAFEPGEFDPETMAQMTTRGLTMFMQLPGALEPRETFERTVDAARELATALNGELCDETRSVLTAQTVSHLKERVEAYRLRVQMASVRDRRRG